ncbi:hypothetical protein N7471_009521 [Penicillium samsonianum]|uniref:uncharacterized protein n=1 Tax=Penicillium samsonianum TaxID=1882272 RepID=UPI0025472C31|nr:uncharacterized protein N7471_009521 [Penicillium samsonianum]KAJ6128304.1 hypothetical protein N7471_009521 [Penicillium samsonianum]
MESVSPYAVSATNRSGLIVIVETLFMTWMIIVGLIRLYMRLAINGPVKLDDVVVFTGSAMAIAHVGTIMDAISHGLGRSEDESSLPNLIRAAKGVYAANLLFLAGHGAAKISICLLLKQLGRQKGYLLCAKVLLGIVMAWTFASIIAVALSCFPQNQFTMAQHCGNIGIAWKMITAFDVITDVLTFGLCILLVWGVQMGWKQKSAVVFAFGTRAPVVILIILRQTYLNHSLFHPDAPLHLSNSMVVTAILLHCSIMVSTVPCLKPFVISFNTGWGQGVTNSNGQNSYFTPTGKSASTNQSHVYSMNRGEGDEVDLTASRQSQDSQHSQRLIIHQTREWKVEEEEYEMHSIQDRI